MRQTLDYDGLKEIWMNNKNSKIADRLGCNLTNIFLSTLIWFIIIEKIFFSKSKKTE